MSIKLKMIFTIIVSMFIIAIITSCLLHVVYKKNTQIIMNQILENSRDAFANLEDNDNRALSATLKALLQDTKIKELFLQGDREALYKYTAPTFEIFKKRFRITHWYFLFPETGSEQTARKCFLRVHNFPKHSDVITRFTYEKAVKTKTFSYGKELGKTAFALRVVHPYYSNGQLIGYMELGQEIDHFLSQMKDQTQSDYGLLIEKKYLNQEKWKSVRESKGLQNNWNDFKDLLLVDETAANNEFFKFDGKIVEVPDEGRILGRIQNGKQTFMRGIFPIYDAGDRKVGCVLINHNVTELYTHMQMIQVIIFVVILCSIVLISAFILFIFNRLILNRFHRLTKVLTRVVGGDFENKIITSSDDEIGNFEKLFEQFRVLFVDSMTQNNE